MRQPCLECIEGRFQLATYGKFNRPDPMRDWDWTRPHTLNLYEYAGNDPINVYDPDGYGRRWYNFWHNTDLTDEEYDAMIEARNQEEYTGQVDVTMTVVEDSTMSRNQYQADKTGIVARWNVDGHMLGAYEARAYNAGLSLDYIYQARNYSSSWEGSSLVTYDGHGTEVDRFNVPKEIGKAALIAIVLRKGNNLLSGRFRNSIGIPKSWTAKPSKKGGGVQYVDPKNPHNRVRVMPGKPSSPNIAQRKPYVKKQINGKFYDKNGKVVPGGSRDAHIPLDDFKF